jgi:N-acetylglucosamine kinase-like BadF-type ATPase
MLFIGIDVGGTKTEALVVDGEGLVVGQGRAGPGNWESVGLEGAYTAMDQALGQALAQARAEPGDVAGAGFGLAGLDWPSDEARLRPLVERLGLGGPQVLVNDSFIALRAGTREPWGVGIVAGTGTTVGGWSRKGEMARTLGLGYPFDDWGSAPDIAYAAIHAIAQAYTGRGSETDLTERVIAISGADGPAELLERLSRGQYELEGIVPQLVQAVFAAAREADGAALAIVERAARELGGGAAAVIRRLGMEAEVFDVVLAGGLFLSRDALLLERLEAEIRPVAPRARLVPLEARPVVGGVLLGMEAAGWSSTSSAWERLNGLE